MSDGPQPPARVARPALSQALLERVRAAVQADAEAEAEDHPQEPAAIPLPRRDPARSGGPQPRARVAQPVSRPETSSPGDANTEPIPVIPVIAEPAALAQNAAPSKPEAAPALPKRKPDQAPAGAKAAEPKAAEPKAVEPKAAGRAAPRPAPPLTGRPPGSPRLARAREGLPSGRRAPAAATGWPVSLSRPRLSGRWPWASPYSTTAGRTPPGGVTPGRALAGREVPGLLVSGRSARPGSDATRPPGSQRSSPRAPSSPVIPQCAGRWCPAASRLATCTCSSRA